MCIFSIVKKFKRKNMPDIVTMTTFGVISGVISLTSLAMNKLTQPMTTIEKCKPSTYQCGYYSYEISSKTNSRLFDAFIEYFMYHQNEIPNKNCPILTFPSIGYAFRLPAFNTQYTIKTNFGNIFLSIFAPDHETPEMIIIGTKKGSIFYRSRFMRFLSFGTGYLTRRKHNKHRLLLFLEYVIKSTNIKFSDIETMDRTKYKNILERKQAKRFAKQIKNGTEWKHKPIIPREILDNIEKIKASKTTIRE